MGHFFEDGGFTMVPILLMGFGLTGVCGLEALRPSARLRGVAISLSGAMAAAGGLGFVMAAITTLRASLELPDEVRLKILLAGLAESANNLVLALVFLVLAGCLLAVGALRGRAVA